MAIKTRKPTGIPPWPILLLAGAEKVGKSYTAAAFSSSDLIDRTFWIEIGEGSADQYGAIPGARYEIVEHDGTYEGMLKAASDAASEPPKGDKPNAIVVDSMTELWDLLTNEQQAVATKRGKNTITIDQWTAAKRKWRRFFDTIRAHSGPVILTSRFEQVTVMDKDGKPTTDKQWKIRAEKNAAFEVDGVVQIPHPRQFYLTGMRSLRFPIPIGGNQQLPQDFSLDWFMHELGLAEGAGKRSYTAPTVPEEAVQEQADQLSQAEIEDDPNSQWDGAPS